ncbi:TauD/TfdA family dioxygenase [Siccirubricoccus sp. G192]|nr:TauD/TfdA family dioxygenase [Siccirubricoccus sp. G192]MBV1797282.1 TauD/TfdA family dioxygenase [Siccirubricoccus sp. G192]
MTLQLTPLHPLFVAEVRGIDLRQTPGPELCAEIDRAMDRYAVLVFPGQEITDDQQMAFGEALGPLEQTRGVVDVHKQRLAHRQMADISNIDLDGKLLAADDRRRMFNLGNQLWHSDSSFKSTPAKYSMLLGRSIPPEGGETGIRRYARRLGCAAGEDEDQGQGSGLRAQPDLLARPARLQRIHGAGAAGLRAGAAAAGALASGLGPAFDLPVLAYRPHPRLADAGSHGADPPIGGIATQRPFVHTHHWRQWDLVMWDNRATMHRARPYEDQTYPRDMRRVTLTDVAPTLEQPVPERQAA